MLCVIQAVRVARKTCHVSEIRMPAWCCIVHDIHPVERCCGPCWADLYCCEATELGLFVHIVQYMVVNEYQETELQWVKHFQESSL